MESYITGSRAYGYPRPNSDIDLVIVASREDLKTLWQLNPHSYMLQWGNLNLVTFNLDSEEDMKRYAIWKRVHNELVARKPVTKEEAILAFREAGAEKNYIKPTVVEIAPGTELL